MHTASTSSARNTLSTAFAFCFSLVVKKCKFLQESNCKGMCLNSCKLPAQQLFDELGVPLRVSPNFETQV